MHCQRRMPEAGEGDLASHTRLPEKRSARGLPRADSLAEELGRTHEAVEAELPSA